MSIHFFGLEKKQTLLFFSRFLLPRRLSSLSLLRERRCPPPLLSLSPLQSTEKNRDKGKSAKQWQRKSPPLRRPPRRRSPARPRSGTASRPTTRARSRSSSSRRGTRPPRCAGWRPSATSSTRKVGQREGGGERGGEVEIDGCFFFMQSSLSLCYACLPSPRCSFSLLRRSPRSASVARPSAAH